MNFNFTCFNFQVCAFSFWKIDMNHDFPMYMMHKEYFFLGVHKKCLNFERYLCI